MFMYVFVFVLYVIGVLMALYMTLYLSPFFFRKKNYKNKMFSALLLCRIQLYCNSFAKLYTKKDLEYLLFIQ